MRIFSVRSGDVLWFITLLFFLVLVMNITNRKEEERVIRLPTQIEKANCRWSCRTQCHRCDLPGLRLKLDQ